MQDILSTTLCDTPLSRIPVSGEARSWEVSMKIGDKFFIPEADVVQGDKRIQVTGTMAETQTLNRHMPCVP